MRRNIQSFKSTQVEEKKKRKITEERSSLGELQDSIETAHTRVMRVKRDLSMSTDRKLFEEEQKLSKQSGT